MYLVLSVAAAFVALIVTAFGVFAAYMLWSGKREMFTQALRQWTVFDYIILSVFILGTLFLLADLTAVLKDRQAYPYYHYGYLLSGFIYNLLAGIFLFVRLGLTFRLLGGDSTTAEGGTGEGAAASRDPSAANDNHRKPDKA
jgi:hypothetical protein